MPTEVEQLRELVRAFWSNRDIECPKHPGVKMNGSFVQTTFAEDYSKEGVSYTVQKGDTLALIAKKTGAKTQDIINANKLSDPSRINAGQTLFIPGGK